MQSPGSKKRPWDRKRVYKKAFEEKVHLNKPFYNTKKWKDTRQAYLNSYQVKLFSDIPTGHWVTKFSSLEVKPHRQSHILSLDYLPCEVCLRLFIVGVYKKIAEGTDVDHINPLNPDNALDYKDWGDPYDHNNLQLLCKRHHNAKTGRDRKKKS